MAESKSDQSHNQINDSSGKKRFSPTKAINDLGPVPERSPSPRHILAGGDPIALVIGEIMPDECRALGRTYTGQRYRAWLEDGTYVVEASWQPFCDGARELLAIGFDPQSVLTMKRHGQPAGYYALKGILGEVAKVTVEENGRFGPRFRSYRPFSATAVYGEPENGGDEDSACLSLEDAQNG